MKKKVGELIDYVDRAPALIREYVPPSPEKMQSVFEAGTASIDQAGPGQISLRLGNYLQSGDALIFTFDEAAKAGFGERGDHLTTQAIARR